MSEPVEINLQEESGQAEMWQALSNAGIPAEDSQEFFREMEHFQSAVGDATDEDMVADRWEKAYPGFVGMNCRITAFMLARSLVKVEGGAAPAESADENLFLDLEAIRKAPVGLWSGGDNGKFECLFVEMPAAGTKDTGIQCEQVQKAWKGQDISFADGEASIVTVWLHSKPTPEEDILFPGHVGVLVSEDSGKLLFAEKLAFQRQYRALRFEGRTSLNAYLMGSYDLDENRPAAHTFLTENDRIMQEYRVSKKGA